MSKLTLMFKDRVLKIFPLKAGKMIIGSDPSCAIHIDSLAVQPYHAYIETTGQESLLYDMGSAEDGTYVNGHRINEAKSLKDADIIGLGKHTLAFSYEEAVATAPADTAEPSLELETGNFVEPEKQIPDGKRNAWLQILNGSSLGKTMSLNRSMTNLGKQGLSTAVITRREEGYFLSHLEGKYPPLLGDTPIGNKSVKLQDGDTIRIGNIKMQFYYE